MLTAGVCILAVLLDRWLGEPNRWHPVVGFGTAAAWLEKRMNRSNRRVIRGAMAACFLMVPVVAVGWLATISLPTPLLVLFEVLVLWLMLSLRGLSEHGLAVANAMQSNDLPASRAAVGLIVSRNPDELTETGVATAATESMLENGADAVFASLFWFAVAGLPGVLLHRMANTLDAMWGYRNDRFLYFGRFAARLDDVMNWIPARLTAATYALLGDTRTAWRCWRQQGAEWESPNAGPVMAAGAGALNISLGGPAPYAEGLRERPLLGRGPLANAQSISASIDLVRRGVWLWLAALVLLALAGVGS
ncbi:adenosylcobinamide-phosphate synthase CbiB [Marinobacter sp. 1Y8]